MKYFVLGIATAIVLSPFWLVWKVSGKEGMTVFIWVIGGFLGTMLLYLTAHWALETVLVTLGFDKKAINKNHGRCPTVIFWK